LGGALLEMSPILGTSPKMTFSGSLPSRVAVWGPHGSNEVAGSRGVCWEVQFGTTFAPNLGPHLVPIWTHIWFQIGTKYGSDLGPKMGPNWDPVWVQIGTTLGPNSGPYLVQNRDQKWSRFGTKMGPNWDPVWVQIETNYGSNLGPNRGQFGIKLDSIPSPNVAPSVISRWSILG
jgi:hypothetical protein